MVTLIKVLSSLLLVFIPVLTGLFGFMLAKFLRLSIFKRRLFTIVGITVGTPCVVLTADTWGIAPALLVLLEGILGTEKLLFNLLSAILSVSLLTCLVFVGERALK